MLTLNISQKEVTNGPLAIAGSIPNFLKAIGISMPNRAAVDIERIRVEPTLTPTIESP